MSEIRLTQYSKGAGCGCKIAPKDLQEILEGCYVQEDVQRLLVGNRFHDDAAVYAIDDEKLLIATTDFFTPIVDNAFDFGRIASANAISDVYAMGGQPLLAIAILGWPVGKLPNALAREVINGATEICSSLKIPLAGGHSIDAPEPFFGLSVNGMVQKHHLKKNSTAKAGDLLYMTKALGTGVLTTALKRGLLPANLHNTLLTQLTRVNTEGQFFAGLNCVSAMTDITGFGLAGHLSEMCKGAGLSADLNYASIPVLDGVDTFTKQFVYPDNTMRNYAAVSAFMEGLNASNMFVLTDPQTNGGLMVTVASSQKEFFENECLTHGVAVKLIGEMIPGKEKQIYVM